MNLYVDIVITRQITLKMKNSHLYIYKKYLKHFFHYIVYAKKEKEK
jgi:hypothetical protein